MIEHTVLNLCTLILSAACGHLLGWRWNELQHAHTRGRWEDRRRDDRGAVEWRGVAYGVALGAIVIVVAVSSVRSEQAVDRVEANGRCSARILTQTLNALNERTTFSEPAAQATNDIRRAQAALVDELIRQPQRPAAIDAAAAAYRSKLAEGIRVTDGQDVKREQNPYPTAETIVSCYQRV